MLVVAQSAPWPPRGGGDLRTANTLAALASAGLRTGFVALTQPQTPPHRPHGVETWFPLRAEPAAEDAARALDWIREPGGHPSDRWWTSQARTTVEEAIAELDPQLVVLEHLWTRRTLELDGYARVDFRVTADGEPLVLEINTNPGIAPDAGFAAAAARAGIRYDQLIERILDAARLR